MLYDGSMQDMAEARVAVIFRANVRAILAAKGWTIQDLADRLNTKRPGISRVLSGDESVTLARAERIADALGVEFTDLFQTVEKISARS